MNRRSRTARILLAACALAATRPASATGVPISGFAPLVGISLSDKFDDGNGGNAAFFQAQYEPSLSGTQFGAGGTPFYDVALLDTGAAATLITSQSDAAFNIAGAGFRGTEPLPLGGATGFLTATINDPMAIYATGLANRTGTLPLTLNTSTFVGQSSISLATLPAESDLPNVLGIPFSSQYATYIRNDQPQVFRLNGQTVRTPQIQFLSLGSGGQGITRRVPITLDDPSAFASPPAYIFNILNVLNGGSLTDDPQAPTVLATPAGQVAAAYFLPVNVSNAGQSLSNSSFFFDTGADVTVVSELNAVRLGFDPVLDEPEFTVAIVGSGGTTEQVPGFFVDQFTIQAVGGSITLTNVPVIVLDVVNPAHPGNVVDGIVGMNLLSGRNVVIDPKPAIGGGGVGPSLYIGDPVTTQKNWTTAAASGTFATGGNWNAGTAPTTLGIANVRHVSGGNQTAIVAADATVWELNVSGSASQSMTVEVNSGVTLTTYSGINIESIGVVALAGGALDAQFVEIAGGTLRGAGQIVTGSGPIPGQVENRGGTVAPGTEVGKLEIEGRFASDSAGTLAIDLGGLIAATQYDKLAVDGSVAIAGTLAVALADLGGGTFVPSVGDAFTIITATDAISGSFGTLVAPGGYNWNLTYGTNSVTLSIGVPGDYNDNGIVDAADYTVWRNSLGASVGILPADGDGSGSVDAGDYAIWKMHFGESLGSGGGSSAVPEPASLRLLLFALVALATTPRRRPPA